MASVKGRNMVIDGDYMGKQLGDALGLIINIGIIKSVPINNDTVESFEIRDEQPLKDVYVVLINFKDGKKSLIEIDGDYYMTFKRTFIYKI